jgi:hypothetical protein
LTETTLHLQNLDKLLQPFRQISIQGKGLWSIMQKLESHRFMEKPCITDLALNRTSAKQQAADSEERTSQGMLRTQLCMTFIDDGKVIFLFFICAHHLKL